MFPYFFIIIYIYIVFLISNVLFKDNLVYRNIFNVALDAIGLIILQGLRHEYVGIDTTAYLYYFNQMHDIGISDIRQANFQFGYLLFSKLCSLFNLSNQQFIFINAFVIISLISLSILKYSKNIFLSFFIFICLGFYTFPFSAFRQGIALAITFYSLKYIIDKRPYMFLITLFFAISFHLSALIFLFGYYIFHIKLNKTLYLVIILCYAIFIVLRTQIAYYLTNLFFPKYLSYLGGTDALLLLLFMISIFIFSQIFNKDYNDKNINGLSNFMLVAATIQLFATESYLILRMAYYFYFSSILLIPNIISTQKILLERIIMILTVVIFISSFFIYTISGGYLNIVPYNFYWITNF